MFPLPGNNVILPRNDPSTGIGSYTRGHAAPLDEAYLCCMQDAGCSKNRPVPGRRVTGNANHGVTSLWVSSCRTSCIIPPRNSPYGEFLRGELSRAVGWLHKSVEFGIRLHHGHFLMDVQARDTEGGIAGMSDHTAQIPIPSRTESLKRDCAVNETRQLAML